MHYEVHSLGDPLVASSGRDDEEGPLMGPLVPALASSRKVITIEPQAHGHTVDINRPLNYEQLADDTAALDYPPGT